MVNYKEEEEYRIMQEKRKEEQRRLREEKEKNRIAYSAKEALDFYESIKDHNQRSLSGHIYPYGRKPSPYDYDRGLEQFFGVGEHRLVEEDSGIIFLETWNGHEWMREDDRKCAINREEN